MPGDWVFPRLFRAMKRMLLFLAIGLVFLAGIALVVYPMVSNTLYEQNQSHVRAEYDAAVEEAAQDRLDAALQAARDYNRVLLEGSYVLTDPFDPLQVLDPTVEPYASLLNLAGDGVMGSVEIPKIDVDLSIYHGTTPDVLEKGVGHLQNTSLPAGGEDTHTVLTAHTGLAGKRLFTDLTELEAGDVFYLHILGEVFAYQVFRVEIVEPTDTRLLLVERGRDLATLVTCHPYGINTHRLLVSGERIPYEEAVERQTLQAQVAPPAESLWEKEYRDAVLLCLAVYIPLTLLALLVLRRRRRRHKHLRSSSLESREL